MSNQSDHRFLNGKAVQKRILNEIYKEISVLNKHQDMGKIVSISIGNVDEIAVYIRGQARAAKMVGIPFEEQYWPEDITQELCKKRIVAMNRDPGVIGVILQRPVPKQINIRSLQSSIHPLKDIEGMSPTSIGNIVYNDLVLSPCTAAASVEMIRETGLDIKGLEVVVIGHSEIVGKPAAFMLMAEGATVTVCHHMTRSVASHSRRADVVLVAVGIPNFLKDNMVKPGAAVIDIGINQVRDDKGNNTIVGDVDTQKVKEIASWITPVPGGVGPVTVAILMRNSLVAYKRQLQLM